MYVIKFYSSDPRNWMFFNLYNKACEYAASYSLRPPVELNLIKNH